MLDLNVDDTRYNVLDLLNEMLLLTYGTKTYEQILSAIRKSVKNIEQKHLTTKYWQ